MKRLADLPVVLALRLQVENRRIVEIEQLVQRNLGDYSMPNLTEPRPGLLEELPESDVAIIFVSPVEQVPAPVPAEEPMYRYP